MRILVTGSRGKVGSATVDALHRAGHEVTACDLGAPVFEAPEPGAPRYLQADLTDAGHAFAALRGHDAVIHAAAIPEPTRNAPQVVFQNNLMSAFNTLEAAIRLGVGRYVNVSSETVPGFFFPEREFLPDYAPVDEEHPVRPQDPYATAKHFSEQLMDAAMRRSDIRCLTIRPSWVQWEGNYATNLGPALRDPEDTPSASFWSRLRYPDELLAETTLEAQGRALGRWALDAFEVLADDPPPTCRAAQPRAAQSCIVISARNESRQRANGQTSPSHRASRRTRSEKFRKAQVGRRERSGPKRPNHDSRPSTTENTHLCTEVQSLRCGRP